MGLHPANRQLSMRDVLAAAFDGVDTLAGVQATAPVAPVDRFRTGDEIFRLVDATDAVRVTFVPV